MKKIYITGILIILALSACFTERAESIVSLTIHDIQGCNHSSPYLGKLVYGIVGVVTYKNSNGFTMQSVTQDELTCTSEGIYVYTGYYPDIMAGDLVSVDGTVQEYVEGEAEDHNLSQTEIVSQSKINILKSDHAMPTAVVLDDLAETIPMTIIDNDGMSKFDPKEDGLDFFEGMESMLVEIRNGEVVAPRNGYNEIIILPDSFALANLISNQGALVITEGDANPEKVMIKMPGNYSESVNVGDRLENPVTGVMDYSYGNYKIVAITPLKFLPTDKTIVPFTKKSDGLTIATYNVENLSPMDGISKFDSIAKQIADVLQSPDVLVLNEIMDNSGSIDNGVVKADQTVEILVKAIQKAGGAFYLFSDTPPANNQDGGILGGNIRTILLYREDVGITLETESSTSGGIKYLNSQYVMDQNPSLIGENSQVFNGARKPRIWLLNKNGFHFFVVGVHLTSQSANNPEWGDQQPPQKPEESQREAQAQLISQELIYLYKQNPAISIFIAGDMNDLPWSETINILENDNFIDCGNPLTPAENYSYIYEGNAQQLDYILVNKNLAINVLQARFMHVNSLLDQDESISDHDPLMIEYSIGH